MPIDDIHFSGGSRKPPELLNSQQTKTPIVPENVNWANAKFGFREAGPAGSTIYVQSEGQLYKIKVSPPGAPQPEAVAYFAGRGVVDALGTVLPQPVESSKRTLTPKEAAALLVPVRAWNESCAGEDRPYMAHLLTALTNIAFGSSRQGFSDQFDS